MDSKILIVLLVGMIFLAGCCGTASNLSSSNNEQKVVDKYESNYGKHVTIGNFGFQLNKIVENPANEEGVKSFDITFTVENNGKEKEDIGRAIYIKDSDGRYFEADWLSCNFMMNPGISKTDTCSFPDVPSSAELDSIVLKGFETDYTPIFKIGSAVSVNTATTLKNDTLSNNKNVNSNCSDGTLSGKCSPTKPNYCNSNLQLINNSEQCGCEQGYESQNNICILSTPKCQDGTVYGNCSSDKPLYCNNGQLINKASQCGCDSTEFVLTPVGDICRNYYWNKEGQNIIIPEYSYGGELKVTIHSILLKNTEDTKIVIINITAENVGQKSRSIFCLSDKLTDTQGREFDGKTISGYTWYGDIIQPGMKISGFCTFEMPLNAEPKSITLDSVEYDLR